LLPFAVGARDDRDVHRKVVTVLFCDVVGSTALGESVDPEALQGLLSRDGLRAGSHTSAQYHRNHAETS
jgi:class 3 adenylate cyclase